MAASGRKYDVAISFVAQDEPLALSVRGTLQPPLAVFVFSEAQEQLAGRDGIEAFRSVFREQAQLVVVLYRQGWGETPWTRVEKLAIEEFAHEHGWERLMFVRIDTLPVPKWVPKPHLYLDFNRFTLTDLAGAIKSRLVELDVEVKTVSPAERAAALAGHQAFDAETRQLLTNRASDFMQTQDALLNALIEEAAAVSEKTGWQVAAGKGALIGGFVVSAQGQGLQIVPQNLYANTAREACLWVREYDMNLQVEQPGMRSFAMGPMDFGRTRRLDIRRLPAPLGWCWELDGRIYPPREAAQAIMGILLDRIENAKEP